MKTLLLCLQYGDKPQRLFYLLIILLGLGLAWQLLPSILSLGNATVGLVDAGIWQLWLFSIICWCMLLLLSFLIFQLIRQHFALPAIQSMVSQFKNLQSWQQLSFYYACFALLLLAGLGCLVAVF